MRSAQPPGLATWLLNKFGSGPNNPSIIGDLNERYSHGRSDLWYWRQAILAIVMSFFKEVWGHKLLTVRAVLTGWIVFFVSRYAFKLTWELLSALASWSRFWPHDWITVAVQIPEIVLSGVLAGWLIANLHRQSQKAMVLAYAAYFAGVQIAWLLPGLLTEPFRFYPFVYGIWFIIMTPLGILVGGGVFGSAETRITLKESSATPI